MLIVILLVCILAFSGGGFYMGGPALYGGNAIGIVLAIVLVLLLLKVI